MPGAVERIAQDFKAPQDEGMAPTPLNALPTDSFPPPHIALRYHPGLSYKSAREIIRRTRMPDRPDGPSILRRAGLYAQERGTTDKLFNARQQLVDLGAPTEVVDTLFTDAGEWKHVDESGTNFFEMEPDDAFEYVIGFLQPEFTAITTYLDEPTSTERPYNEHGERHARETKEKARELLLHGGHIGPFADQMRPSFKYPMDITPKQLETYSNIASAIHDIGYILGDDIHPEASVYLAEQIFPQIRTDNNAWEIIQSAVLLHEGDNMKSEMRRRRIKTPMGVVRFLERQYPTVAALQLADKAGQHLRRTRDIEILERKAEQGVDPRDYLNDPHVENNALMPITFANWELRNYEGDGTQIAFRIQTEFTPEISTEDAEKYPYYTKRRTRNNGVKLAVSPRTRQLYLDAQEAGKPTEYFDILRKQALDLGATRYLAMVYASFALNPNQDMADLVFFDPDLNNPNRPGLTKAEGARFWRETIDEDVDRYWNQVVPESRRAKRAPEELKI